jgi:hypothetical protein
MGRGDLTNEEYPVPRNKEVEHRCNINTIHLDPAKDVEQQVFHPYAYDFQVRGYFLVNYMETHMSAQFLSLKPISAQQVLT